MASAAAGGVMREDEAEEVAFLDENFIRMYGLHPNNALDYFALSPFYDRKSNNELVRMQKLGLEVLNSMKGVEYRLLHTGHEPVLFTVVKQQRVSQTVTRKLALYYILDRIVYAAPGLKKLILSRLLKSSTHVQQAFDLLNSAMRYAPSKGFTWHFEGDDPSLKLWRQSAEGLAYEARRKRRDERLERRGEEEINGILGDLVTEFLPADQGGAADASDGTAKSGAAAGSLVGPPPQVAAGRAGATPGALTPAPTPGGTTPARTPALHQSGQR